MHGRRRISHPVEKDGVYIFSDTRLGGAANCYFLFGENEDYLIDCLSGAQGANLWDAITTLRKEKNQSERPLHILLTHIHPDHAGGLADFIMATNVTVHCHPGAIECLKSGCDWDDIMKNGKVSKLMKIPNFADPLPLKDTDKFYLNSSANIQCIFTLGHSRDSVCYYVDTTGLLFTGDTFYYVAKPSLLDAFTFGDWKEFAASLNKLLVLHPSIIFPGHDEPVLYDVFEQQVNKTVEYIEKKINRSQKKSKVGKCIGCGIRAVGACAQCKSAVYCGKTCQIIHWSVHSRTCKTRNI